MMGTIANTRSRQFIQITWQHRTRSKHRTKAHRGSYNSSEHTGGITLQNLARNMGKLYYPPNNVIHLAEDTHSCHSNYIHQDLALLLITRHSKFSVH